MEAFSPDARRRASSYRQSFCTRQRSRGSSATNSGRISNLEAFRYCHHLLHSGDVSFRRSSRVCCFVQDASENDGERRRGRTSGCARGDELLQRRKQPAAKRKEQRKSAKQTC